MSTTCILIIAYPGANLDSLTAVLPALVANAELLFAAEASDALAAVDFRHPQLVIIDSEIGYADARAIHSLLTSKYPEIRIIVLSDAANWQRWKTARGAQQVLLKGFSTRRLTATLSKVLGSSTQLETSSTH